MGTSRLASEVVDVFTSMVTETDNIHVHSSLLSLASMLRHSSATVCAHVLPVWAAQNARHDRRSPVLTWTLQHPSPDIQTLAWRCVGALCKHLSCTPVSLYSAEMSSLVADLGLHLVLAVESGEPVVVRQALLCLQALFPSVKEASVCQCGMYSRLLTRHCLWTALLSLAPHEEYDYVLLDVVTHCVPFLIPPPPSLLTQCTGFARAFRYHSDVPGMVALFHAFLSLRPASGDIRRDLDILFWSYLSEHCHEVDSLDRHHFNLLVQNVTYCQNYSFSLEPSVVNTLLVKYKASPCWTMRQEITTAFYNLLRLGAISVEQLAAILFIFCSSNDDCPVSPSLTSAQDLLHFVRDCWVALCDQLKTCQSFSVSEMCTLMGTLLHFLGRLLTVRCLAWTSASVRETKEERHLVQEIATFFAQISQLALVEDINVHCLISICPYSSLLLRSQETLTL